MSDSILSRYQVAKRLVEGNLSKDLIHNDAVFPHWIGDSHLFWYQRDTPLGKEYRLVDADTGVTKAAFNHEVLAIELEQLSGQTVNVKDLPIIITELSLYPLKICFEAFDKSWIFDAHKLVCSTQITSAAIDGLLSPDGKKKIFVRDSNLWVQNVTNLQERALTNDGTSAFPYGTAPCVYGHPNSQLQALWSPDSQCVLTHQLDLRGVATRRSMFPISRDGSSPPEILEYKAAYPGDKKVETYHLSVIHIDTGRIQEVNYRSLFLCRFGLGYFSDERFAWWRPDSCTAYFLDVERGAKAVRVVEFDWQSGSTNILLEENSETFIRLSHAITEAPLFMPLPDTDELIWFSERDGWGHLYLYDMNKGELKHRITEGEWIVRNLLHFDENRRELLLQTSGRDSNINPYYQDICLVNIDSGNLKALASGAYEHLVFQPDSLQVIIRNSFNLDVLAVNGVAPSGNYVVMTRSRVDTLPVSVLLDRNGREILILETAQTVELPTDWQWPEPVSVKGSDGQTDLYGVIFRPPGFSPEKIYPVLDFCQAFPYYSSLPQGSFINDVFCGDSYLIGSAYAALGFIVVALNLPGMPYRHKAFQDKSYGRIPSVNAFEDRIGGFQQLAKRYPYIDLNRVGIVGCDYTTGGVYGLLEHPEFYKVGINVAFDDSRYGIASMVEMYEGMRSPERPYQDKLVSSLQGKLLLIHGLKDLDAPPETTLQLVGALQKANKDFDMILEPEGIHIVSSYALRRTWDYLVTHLLKMEPPESFTVTTAYDRVFSQASVGGEKDSQSEGTETLLPPESDRQSEVES